MPIDSKRAKDLLTALLQEIADRSGAARTDHFPNLRSVDAKVREVKMILADAEAAVLLAAMERDTDFEANSRRVRLEALAHHVRTALRFFDTGLIRQERQLVPGPDLRRLTGAIPDLEAVIQSRWLDAQRCQHASAYLAAVILMGSILEALLLARCLMSPGEAHQAPSAPKDKNGKQLAIHTWSLHALIEVAVERRWLKSDRASFGHGLRESRNIVHPYAHARSGANFDEATCKVSWHVLNASVDDLLASV